MQLVVCMSRCAFAVVPAVAQAGTPSVSVSDQIALNGRVMIDSVYSAGQGFVVIHIDNNGQPGRVAGFAPVQLPGHPVVATATGPDRISVE